ncbi:cadherin-related family member 1-like [Branchiostoma floridae]|uniref:Cadherin-related family member 1-like n=1 Tax=Branchiostoma floridae TaxID=7739 RepID=A0A9J7KT93_BRAFL|nr:cadherin-related family member 1-like [Branchiostoma floridae]
MEGEICLTAIIMCIGVCTVEATSPTPMGTSESRYTTVPTLTTPRIHLVFLHEPYFGVVAENADVGTTVMQVTASGSPRIDPSRIQYSIAQEDEQGFFKLNETTGVITTSSVIDREAGLEDKSAPRVFTLIIQVRKSV